MDNCKGIAMSLARSVLTLCLLAAGVCPVVSGMAADSAGNHSSSLTSICHKILDRYRPLAHSHPGERPIDTLVASTTSGVSIGPGAGSVSIDSESDLARYGATQKPPFSISRGLAGMLQEFSDAGGGASLDKAPNLDYYSISRAEGSEGCLQYIFFRVTHGIAAVSPGPAISQDNTCGYGGFFATVDNDPVFVQEHYDFLPGMSARIDVSQWGGDDFQTACSIDLSYTPRFTDKTFNDWKPMCQGDGCDVLHKAAIDLVKAAFQSPSTLYDDSMKRLTSDEQTQYEAMKQVISGDAGAEVTLDTASDDSILTDTSPLRVPYVDHGNVYLVSLGHFTIGWREYADWSVTFSTLEDGKLAQRALFAVGMWKGDLANASIN
jgi:hypothetical protein